MKTNSLKVRLASSLVAVGVLAAAQESRGAITLDFSNLNSSSLEFNSGAFNFVSTGTYQFSITGETGGTGDSVGLQGYVTPGGPFTIGTISSYPGYQTASVTGSATLHITDSAATPLDLTGTVQFLNITTFGAGGILDLTGAVNLTNLSYAGANNDLTALASGNDASDVVSFQFAPAKTLTQLQAASNLTTSYSGTVTSTPEPLPEPTAAALLGVGAVGALSRRRRRVK